VRRNEGELGALDEGEGHEGGNFGAFGDEDLVEGAGGGCGDGEDGFGGFHFAERFAALDLVTLGFVPEEELALALAVVELGGPDFDCRH